MSFDLSSFFIDSEFNVYDGDFSVLEIRDSNKPGGFHYFYDTQRHRLVTDFVLSEGPQVTTLVKVTLIRKEEVFEPRLRFWKRSNRSARHATGEMLPDTSATRSVKASVDTEDGHENLWKVIQFLQSLSSVDAPSGSFRVVAEDAAELARLIGGSDKPTILSAVKTAIGSSLTEADITLLANRKAQLETFERFLRDPKCFESAKVESGKRAEAVWQDFFERNSWIFGYGLTLVACQSLDDEKLERYTTGANIFSGAGKRSDAVMRTRGYIQSLLFGEIKTHQTPLVAKTPYRAPDVYRVSDEVSGAISQVQKTVDKAVRAFQDQIHRFYKSDGTPTGIEFSTIRPRQVLVIGCLDEFESNGQVNPEKAQSFELFRRSVADVDVITFDELLERARFIVRDE